MGKHSLAVVLGTTRPNSSSRKIAESIVEEIKKGTDFRPVLIDPSSIELPHDGGSETANDENYRKVIKKADALLIVSPEYSHGYPGSLKRLLDSIDDGLYHHKPVAVVGVSSGPFGGVRMIQHLTPVLRNLGMVHTFIDVHVPFASDVFKKEELQQRLKNNLDKVLAELKWLSDALKPARENSN